MTTVTQAIEKIEDTRKFDKYLDAMKILHLGQDNIAAWAASRSSSEYGDIRFITSQWDIIANTVDQALDTIDPNDLEIEQTKIFDGVPIQLIWNLLEPGITVIRNEPNHGNFGLAFEGLKTTYEDWIVTASGMALGSDAAQAISTRFG